MAKATPTNPHGSEALTEGVRISVSPAYAPERSDADGRQFVFAYRVRVTNESSSAVTLLSRYWRIVDADGASRAVEGAGVVGRQPTIPPGHAFEYASFCPIATAWGTMEGWMVMRREPRGEAHDDADDEPRAEFALSAGDERLFRATVARFYLVAQEREAITI